PVAHLSLHSFPTRRSSDLRGGFAAASFLIFLVLLALLLFAPPDGIEHAPLLQFVGHFHPLSVHFPIAVLLLVPLFEILGRKRNRDRKSTRLNSSHVAISYA